MEEGRALVVKEREAAMAAARDEVELLKQRMLSRAQEEYAVHLAKERHKMNIDPAHLPAELGRDGQEALSERLNEWKAAMAKEHVSATYPVTPTLTHLLK